MNPRTGYVTPHAGRNRPVSLDVIADLPDPDPLPGDEMDADELSSHAPAAAMASCVLVALAEALNPVDRESLLYLLRPGDQTLRERARVAGCSPATIRSKALRMRAALADGLNTPTAANPLHQRDSGAG